MPWCPSFALARTGISQPSPLGELRDIAGPVAMPPDPLWPILAIAAAICLALAGAGLLLYRWLCARARAAQAEVKAPPRPAHQVALERLHTLESERDPQRFWDGLAATLRIYIDTRYDLALADATSSEVLATVFEARDLSEPHRGILRRVFTTADLARFAAALPDRTDALAAARRFVLETAPYEPVFSGLRS